MLYHLVLCEPVDDAALDRIEAACAILADLAPQIPGMVGFRHGPNRDFEGKSARYTHGFLCTFEDRAAHLAYERHPEHVRAGGMLVAACQGGADGIFVADLEA